MSERTFEDGWRAACESLAATYTDVARDSIALEGRENFSNAAAAARFRANEPDTPAPSDAGLPLGDAIHIYDHGYRKTALRGWPDAGASHWEAHKSGLRAVLDRASTPPMETAAVEDIERLIAQEEARLEGETLPYLDGRTSRRDRVRAARAALTRLRSTTTATNQPKET